MAAKTCVNGHILDPSWAECPYCKKTDSFRQDTSQADRHAMIFISYRRTDSDIAGRISDQLINRFGPESTFLDVEKIPVGRDFRQLIIESIEGSRCVVVVIGTGWIDAITSKEAKNIGTLQNENDYVRVEVSEAIKSCKPIIPVLVGGATMPQPEELPTDIRKLSFINATTVRSGPDFRNDIDYLTKTISSFLPGLQGSASDASYTTSPGRTVNDQAIQITSHDLLNSPVQLSGKMMGRYQIKEFIASGGGGAVFVGYDRNLATDVCLKIAYPVDVEKEKIKALVTRGVKGVVAMRHPGIAAIYDFDSLAFADDTQSFYIAMELLDGINLEQWSKSVERNRDGFLRKLTMAVQLARIINDAHCFRYFDELGVEITGVLHGDIKPANIMVLSDGKPKLTDFMMFNLQQLQLPEFKDRTTKMMGVTGVFGTPCYMAEEQEKRGVISTRTDIFSFGKTLIDLFGVSEYHRMVMAEHGHIFDDILPFTDVDAITKRKICLLIQSMLQKAPELRPASMAVVVDSLESLQKTPTVDKAGGSVFKLFSRLWS